MAAEILLCVVPRAGPARKEARDTKGVAPPEGRKAAKGDEAAKGENCARSQARAPVLELPYMFGAVSRRIRQIEVLLALLHGERLSRSGQERRLR
jgi:hypothetical protein